MSSDLDLIRKAADAAPHRLYGPIATLVQDALAQVQNVAGFAEMVGAIKQGGTAERQINSGIALAKAVLAMPPLSPVSSQDTPPPPRRQWAVQHPDVITTAHNSEHSALYTLSRLPGGVLVTRDHPDQPWQPETDCVCVTVPDTGHYTGCPAALPSVSTDPDGGDR